MGMIVGLGILAIGIALVGTLWFAMRKKWGFAGVGLLGMVVIGLFSIHMIKQRYEYDILHKRAETLLRIAEMKDVPWDHENGEKLIACYLGGGLSKDQEDRWIDLLFDRYELITPSQISEKSLPETVFLVKFVEGDKVRGWRKIDTSRKQKYQWRVRWGELKLNGELLHDLRNDMAHQVVMNLIEHPKIKHTIRMKHEEAMKDPKGEWRNVLQKHVGEGELEISLHIEMFSEEDGCGFEKKIWVKPVPIEVVTDDELNAN
ncbi:hypothetical protein JD969_05025 [Planctomycetota bacterium]|nr:hypothetical protein JD969_05025 [Planctomycetota bacterium]